VSDIPREIAWLPQEALDRMHSDLQAAGDITRAQLAERIVDDAAPLAAYELVSLMSHSEDDNIRLNAAKYLLDRVNGKPKTSTTLNVTQDNPVLQILDGVVVERPIPPTPPRYSHQNGQPTPTQEVPEVRLPPDLTIDHEDTFDA